MVEPPRGESKRRLQFFRLEVRHFLEDLLRRQACGKEIQDIRDTDAHPADTWPSPALLRIHGNVFGELLHRVGEYSRAQPADRSYRFLLPVRPPMMQPGSAGPKRQQSSRDSFGENSGAGFRRELTTRLSECSFLELHTLSDDSLYPSLQIAFAVQPRKERRALREICG